MTNKDFIKMLLIAVGCDRKYEIDTYRADDGSTVYDINGQSEDGSREIVIDGFGMYDVVLSFLNYIRECPEYDLLEHLNYEVNHLPLKYLLDDNERNALYEANKRHAEEVEKYLEETKYITDWCKENNPCPNCTLNDKKHWDDIHYNCELNHTNRCPELLEYNRKCGEMYEEYNRRKNKADKIQETF